MKQGKNRPTVPERYKEHMLYSEMIRRIKEEIDSAPNENLSAILEMAEQLKMIFWIHEEQWRSDELKEAFLNMKNLPHSVRTWLLNYRDDELEL